VTAESTLRGVAAVICRYKDPITVRVGRLGSLSTLSTTELKLVNPKKFVKDNVNV
jgi:hypothetical protein